MEKRVKSEKVDEFRKILERNVPYRHLIEKIGKSCKVKFENLPEIEGILKTIDARYYLVEFELSDGHVIYFFLKNCLYLKCVSKKW